MLFFSKRFLNLPMVSPSGTSSGDVTPQNSENARLSMTSVITRISARSEVLQQKDSQHQFQRIRFIAVLSFVIAWLNDFYECIPRYDAFNFIQKFFFAGSGLFQLIVHHGQCQLCFNIPIIPRFSPLCNCAVLP